MTKYLIGLWLLVIPVVAYSPLTPYVKHMDQAFMELLILCLNGGKASIWLGHKFERYVECKPVATPKRFPK